MERLETSSTPISSARPFGVAPIKNEDTKLLVHMMGEANNLSLESLRVLELYVNDIYEDKLSQRNARELECLINAAVTRLYQLANEELINTSWNIPDLEALERGYEKLEGKYKWRCCTVLCTYPDEICASGRDCPALNEKFDGRMHVQESLFSDKETKYALVLCAQCCKNGCKDTLFVFDAEECIKAFQKWTSRQNECWERMEN